MHGYHPDPARSSPFVCNGIGSVNDDFANYRIKWTDDVETFFQKKNLSKMPSRKLVNADDSEEERNYDPEIRMPIPKPSSTALSR